LIFQALGGTGFFQRVKRLLYDIFVTVIVSIYIFHDLQTVRYLIYCLSRGWGLSYLSCRTYQFYFIEIMMSFNYLETHVKEMT